MNLNRRNAVEQGRLSGFIRPWCDIPREVVIHVSRLAAETSSDLGALLGVTVEDMSTTHKTDSRSETVHAMIDFWITRDGKDATLIRLLEAMEFIGKLGELERKLAHSLP